MFNNGYYSLRVYYGSDLGVYNNTCVGSYFGFYDYYNGSGTDIRNNIFQGGTYALYSYYSSSSIDYNLYYSLGTNLAYIYNGSANYPTDSSSLAGVDTTKNQNSWEVILFSLARMTCTFSVHWRTTTVITQWVLLKISTAILVRCQVLRLWISVRMSLM